MPVINEEAAQVQAVESVQTLRAYSKVPYALLSQEIAVGSGQDVLDEFNRICGYYKVYKLGEQFAAEGTQGDYIPSTLRYKMVASLINKEARFLFAEAPDMVVEAKGDVGVVSQEAKDQITAINDLLKTVLDSNMFEESLLKAAKDCFVGKRVAGIVNFNEEDGVTISFLPSTQFLYETKLGDAHVLTKFVGYEVIKNSRSLTNKRIFKKKYVLGDDGIVYLEERMYDGTGLEVSEEEFVSTELQPIKLSRIPVSVFVNDGLTGDEDGESEVELLAPFEQYYSKLSNGDADAERKTMNPVKYTVDMDNRSTANLSSSAGSYWDLQSDQNLDHPAPQVGTLESSMNYSEALKTTLDRIKTTAYEQIDMPNITLESLQGAITSGKGLKALYWPLIVRCKEKMKMWGPQLRKLLDIVIEGAMMYPECIEQYTNDHIGAVAYEIKIEQNLPLPEDEVEEKNMDLSEVQAQTMSKKSYMKKWRGLTDGEVDEELRQMALERQILEDSSFGGSSSLDLPYPGANDEFGESTTRDLGTA